MKRILAGCSFVGRPLPAPAPPLFAEAGQRLIPAGSLVSCTTGDARISSKTTAVGDPVLCKVEHRRGDFMLPYGSYLGGEFAEYKDPGHFVGKGYMMLSFDRLYVGDHGGADRRQGGRCAGLQDRRAGKNPGQGPCRARHHYLDDPGAVADRSHQSAAARAAPHAQVGDGADAARDGRHSGSRGAAAADRSLWLDSAGQSSYAPEPPPPADDQQAPQMSYDQPDARRLNRLRQWRMPPLSSGLCAGDGGAAGDGLRRIYVRPARGLRPAASTAPDLTRCGRTRATAPGPMQAMAPGPMRQHVRMDMAMRRAGMRAAAWGDGATEWPRAAVGDSAADLGGDEDHGLSAADAVGAG